MKRAFDILVSLAALILLLPVLMAIAALIWAGDRHSPLFLARRVARGGGEFCMVKFRTMIPNAWKSGVNSTAAGDLRITRVGRCLRGAKLDELPQLWNVLAGDMSLVGPRPQVRADVEMYTPEEMAMLSVRPGITDYASIVFADEGEILCGSADPDLLYNQIIRPWKSRLILLYLENGSLMRDIEIIGLTVLAWLSRERALDGVVRRIGALGASEELKTMASRKHPLEASPPPGAGAIVSCYRPRADRREVAARV